MELALSQVDTTGVGADLFWKEWYSLPLSDLHPPSLLEKLHARNSLTPLAAIEVLSQLPPSHSPLVVEWAKKLAVLGPYFLARDVLSKPGWEYYPELIEMALKSIRRALVMNVLVNRIENHPSHLKQLMFQTKHPEDIAQHVLSQPH